VEPAGLRCRNEPYHQVRSIARLTWRLASMWRRRDRHAIGRDSLRVKAEAQLPSWGADWSHEFASGGSEKRIGPPMRSFGDARIRASFGRGGVRSRGYRASGLALLLFAQGGRAPNELGDASSALKGAKARVRFGFAVVLRGLLLARQTEPGPALSGRVFRWRRLIVWATWRSPLARCSFPRRQPPPACRISSSIVRR
jgi:hypothetical protein